MTDGKLWILKQDYSLANIIPDDTTVDKIPIEGYDKIGKLFHGDLVCFKDNNLFGISSVIQSKKICGVLEYYSKTKYPSNKKGVERFKFIPFSKYYPNFIVSSKCKSKYKKNIIVVIKYLSWNDTLPYGEIVKILGEVDNLDSIYESVLYTNELIVDKRKIDNRIFKNLEELSITNVNDIRDKKVISVDPVGTKDIDDAFHYEKIDNIIKVGIHISNVIDTLQYYRLTYILQSNLFCSLYTPTKVYNMLHDQLSSNILSLIENKDRYTITLWLHIKDNEIISKNIEKTIINNKKQYSYDEFEKYIKKGEEYYHLFECIKNVKYKNITYSDFDTHTFIEKLMIIYNCEVANLFIKFKNNMKAIFRNQENNISYQKKNIDSKLDKFLDIINKSATEYSFINKGHVSLKINNYVHITSPIRRYVDCFNQKVLLSIIEKKYYFDLNINLDCINIYQKSIKKAERMFTKIQLKNLLLMNKDKIEYFAYIYDIDDLYICLYLPDLKISIRKKIIEKNLENVYNLVSIDNNLIIICNKQTNQTIELPIFKLLRINIFSINDSVYPKFKINFI